jgi:hypothetical protein
MTVSVAVLIPPELIRVSEILDDRIPLTLPDVEGVSLHRS